MPGTPAPFISPVTWRSPDYAGNVISVTFTFDNTTLILSGATATRDPGCMYQHVYYGLGPGGLPEMTATSMKNIPAGTVAAFPVVALTSLGFTTIADVFASSQITAGP